ncbi:hypothetical protein C7S18_19650 [Ahniella affigens]|uniref:DUF5063 domain-containing protein n=1 Tax=Ahniella affigens TaxID=2021234 RepID=A0A2P1PWL0_9GAMM|nr:DUF5063 domain-containing protein [Ahniella affigens]AVP99241.1 hypothetical protein C7S18_19650 [Ahniella affigens]
MSPIDQFESEARRYCHWANGADGTDMSVYSALVRVSALYHAALLLQLTAEPLHNEQHDDDATLALEDAEMASVVARTRLLPIGYYGIVFDPLEVPPEQPVIGDVCDDLQDIYRDVADGLRHYDHGRIAAAFWEWTFSFRTHWGDHATGALRALHAYWDATHLLTEGY